MAADPLRPDRDWAHAHPLLRPRYERLAALLATDHHITLLVTEIYRSDARQGWLWAQGRTPEDCRHVGIPTIWARPGPRVTNAFSARQSAHGFLDELDRPASAALDVVPLGPDGRPWTPDDDWAAFVTLTTDPGSLGWQIGLIHFHRSGIAVWDKPHLQLREWSDLAHDVIIGS